MPVDLDTEDTERELVSQLPGYFPRGVGSGHRKLLRPFVDESDELVLDLYDVEDAVQIQNADTIAELEALGEELSTPSLENETVEHYRARLLGESQISTSKGSINDVIEGAANMLQVTKQDVLYEEPPPGSTENGVAQVSVPGTATDDSALSGSEVATYIDRFASAGARIEAILRGTFTYITPTDYTNTNFDATKAYDGLDANGDPKDNGGTYAGLIG